MNSWSLHQFAAAMSFAMATSGSTFSSCAQVYMVTDSPSHSSLAGGAQGNGKNSGMYHFRCLLTLLLTLSPPMAQEREIMAEI